MGQPQPCKYLEEADGINYFFGGEILCGLEVGHEFGLIAVEVLKGEVAVDREQAQAREEVVHGALFLLALQVQLHELQEADVVGAQGLGEGNQQRFVVG